MKETRSVKLHIPDFLSDFYFHLTDENYLECARLRRSFYVTWNAFSPEIKEKVANFMREYVEEQKFSSEDLNNEFSDVLQYQAVTSLN